ncbi:MAG TPA: 4Fe-4S binding protein [Spirochaetota bacterium]|nr:4Fe-4S binding protein [Spirochaetota bacterium]HPV41125.1 4Fe-4S binding protein [Spirochaetota bacterium]
MKAKVDKNICSGCGACEAQCGAGAITVGEYAEIDENLCTGCGVCVEVCPLEAISMK